MEKNTAESFLLNNYLNFLQKYAEYSKTSKHMLKQIQIKITTLSSKHKRTFLNDGDLNLEIKRLSKRNDYESKISEHKLKTIKKTRNELECKLKYIDEEYAILASLPFRSKSSRYLKNQVQDEERLIFIERMKQERERAKHLHEENTKSIQAKIIKKMRLDQAAENELKQSLIEHREERLEKMREKIEAHKRQRNDLILLGDTELKKVYEIKPMFKRLEEKYLNETLLPQMENYKETLSRKRQL